MTGSVHYDSVFRPGLFSGKTVIVTGGGSGLGRCTAHELKSLGARLALVGRYILQPEVFDLLDKGERGAGGEIQLTDAMAKLLGVQPFHALTFDGERHDCGDNAGFIQANIALALERPEIADSVRAFIKNLK